MKLTPCTWQPAEGDNGNTCVFDIIRLYSVCKDGPEMGDPTRCSQGHIRSRASTTAHQNTNSKVSGVASGPVQLSRSYSFSCVDNSTSEHKFQRKWSSIWSCSALKVIFVLVRR